MTDGLAAGARDIVHQSGFTGNVESLVWRIVSFAKLAAAERDRLAVAWLRKMAAAASGKYSAAQADALATEADAIERCEHVPAGEGKDGG